MTTANDPAEPDDDLQIDPALAYIRVGQTPAYLLDLAKSRWKDVPEVTRSVNRQEIGGHLPRRVFTRWWTGIAHAVSMLGLVTASVFAWDREIRVVELQITQTTLNSAVNAARARAADLDWALKIVEPKQYEQDQNLFVSYVSPELASVKATGSVTVVAQNVQFPCILRWNAAGKEEIRHLPEGETILEFPAAIPATVFCGPAHTAGWLQSVYVAVVRNGKVEMPQGSTLGKIPLPLEDGDTVVLHFDQPIPPWNAVCVPVHGEWIMVTLERPWATYDTDKWLSKEWNLDNTHEELPNTALFWAREGNAMLAKELAAYFIAHRNDSGHWGRFRGTMHTGLTVSAAENSVSETMQRIEQSELEVALVVAFELLRKQQPPIGPTIEEEIKHASKILAATGVRTRE